MWRAARRDSVRDGDGNGDCTAREGVRRSKGILTEGNTQDDARRVTRARNTRERATQLSRRLQSSRRGAAQRTKRARTRGECESRLQRGEHCCCLLRLRLCVHTTDYTIVIGRPGVFRKCVTEQQRGGEEESRSDQLIEERCVRAASVCVCSAMRARAAAQTRAATLDTRHKTQAGRGAARSAARRRATSRERRTTATRRAQRANSK